MKIQNMKWWTIIPLIIIFVSVANSWHWIWGLLFIFWGLQGVRSGNTFLVEHISKSENLMTYWLLIGSWFVLGFYFLSALWI